MPGWLKVLSVVLGVIVLLGAAAGGAYWWWQRNGADMIADVNSTMTEAAAFAAGKDSSACVEEAAARAKGSGFTGAIKARLFLTSCLRAARLEPGFCDGVPGVTAILTSVGWQQELNQRYGLNPPFETTVVPPGIQEFCTARALAPAPRGQ